MADNVMGAVLLGLAYFVVLVVVVVVLERPWCLAGCGCALEVPPNGAVFLDCSACEPHPTQTPADHRLSDPRTPAPGDRPDPA